MLEDRLRVDFGRAGSAWYYPAPDNSAGTFGLALLLLGSKGGGTKGLVLTRLFFPVTSNIYYIFMHTFTIIDIYTVKCIQPRSSL